MNRLIKGLLALHLVFQGTPVSQAQGVSQSSLPYQKITDDFLSYIHTSSPGVMIDLVNASHVKTAGIYSFDAYVIDLSQNSKTKAAEWTVSSLRDTRLLSPSADVQVVNIVDPSARKSLSRRGRGPAASELKMRKPILASDIARIAGVKIQEKTAKPAVKSGASPSVTTAVIVIERVNNAPVNWTFIELHGFGVEDSVAMATTIGALSGQIQFNTVAFGPFLKSDQGTFQSGYSRLVFENQRLSQDFVSRPIFAPARPFLVESFVRISPERVKYVRSITHQAVLLQIPHIMDWINSIQTEAFVRGVIESGPIAFVSSAATKSWYVALESSLQNRRILTPELEGEIRRLENRQRWGMFFGEKVFGQLVGSSFGTSPEAWFIFTIAGAAAITKVFYDYHRLMQQLHPPTATTTVTVAASVSTTGSVPSCRDVLGKTHKSSNGQLAGL